MKLKTLHRLCESGALMVATLAIAACDDPQSEAALKQGLPLPSEVHGNATAIAETAEIDALLAEQAAAGWWDAQLFDVDTVRLARDTTLALQETPIRVAPPKERKAYFGDLHVHTTYSFDAYAFATLATPEDAYRFAKGEAIANPAGFEMQLARPMDFYAVTDHGMFLGLVKAAADTTTDFSKTAFAAPYHDLNSADNNGTDFFSVLKRLLTFSSFLPEAVAQIKTGALDQNEVLTVARDTWRDTIDAADTFYEPGHFTTFAAYEYTASTADMGNLHRNVIFEDTDGLPREPFSRFHSVNPEDLWQWMDDLRAQGVESLAIPHNSNGSNGQMFKLQDWAGNPMDDDDARQRIRNEPLVEITQIKGTSETHPNLSSRDEWADFEIMPYRIATAALSQLEGSYVRGALLDGLQFEQRGVTNPYQFGFIGSSDTHSAASQNAEENFVSKLALLSGTPAQRGSVPRTGFAGELSYQGMRLAAKLTRSAMGSGIRIKINGDVYSGGAGPTYGASGLAAAWAEENTRGSLYRAFRRKEVFATSGPRLQIRFFGGFEFEADLLTAPDGVERAYAQGVTMGSVLSPPSTALEDDQETLAPSFLVMASADIDSAPLQRLQIIKGWVDTRGTHETVIDVACAGGASVNVDTQRCPDNGASVNTIDCSINAETGSAHLSALWRDPDFTPDQHAFYYARVIENPTCRWSTWDASRAGVAPRPDLPETIQERAWSSPIHYQPE